METALEAPTIRRELQNGMVRLTERSFRLIIQHHRPRAESQSLPSEKDEKQETKEIMEEWFATCDRILDTHRSEFLLREPSPRELVEHKVAVSECINACHAMLAQLTGDTAPEIQDLAERLRIRITQLNHAFQTFHGSVSDEEAEKLLKELFPQ